MLIRLELPGCWRSLGGIILAALCLCQTGFVNAEDLPAKTDAGPVAPGHGPKKILFFFKCSEYVDPMIRRENERPTTAEQVLGDLGKQNHLAFTFTADGSVFTPQNLAKYDAFCFFTSGDLTVSGADQNPPMTREGKAALLQAIRDGKGFVGIHSAADTFASGAQGVDPYIQMLGGELLVRVRGLEPAHQIVADQKFPGLAAVPKDFGPAEEWYALRNYSTDLHVLLVQDTAAMVRGSYYAPNFPSTWAHLYGRGRVFYTSMGHQAEVWNSPVFQSILAGGLRWSVGDVDADVTPNLDQVTPGVRKQQ